METPPINSLTKEFVFIKTYKPPIYINLEIKFEEEKSNENRIRRTKATKIWIKRREKRFFAHALKNQEELLSERERKAKGDSKIKSFIITYLKE